MASGITLSEESILSALADFDRLGRAAFLAETGFKASTRWFIRHKGKLYDIKAVCGRAGNASASSFSSGAGLVRKVEKLGFKVVEDK